MSDSFLPHGRQPRLPAPHCLLEFAQVRVRWVGVHFLKYSFPSWFIIAYWTQFPVLYTQTSFIHPICNSLHLLTPDSQSTPPPVSEMQQPVWPWAGPSRKEGRWGLLLACVADLNKAVACTLFFISGVHAITDDVKLHQLSNVVFLKVSSLYSYYFPSFRCYSLERTPVSIFQRSWRESKFCLPDSWNLELFCNKFLRSHNYL